MRTKIRSHDEYLLVTPLEYASTSSHNRLGHAGTARGGFPVKQKSYPRILGGFLGR
jgi:hypothetical protein